MSAKVLKLLRISAGLDQRQLAHLTGVSQQQISRMESGRVFIPTEYLDAVAQALMPVINTNFPSEVHK